MIEEFRQLIRDPEGRFSDPRRLLEREDISPNDKLLVLQDWQTDLLELQRAADENMPSAQASPGETAEKLSEVNKVIGVVRARIVQGQQGD
ncbi:MAG: hypothetical protein PVF50_08430 [Gammaproteobacteria bacterium]|jgi:hypothetical protein